MKINKSYQVGLLILCSCFILYFGFMFLKGHNIFAQSNRYYVSYPTNKNLSVAAPVRLKGHVVGSVKKIDIVPKQNYSTLVTIEVDKKFPLNENSKILLSRSSILEGSILELDIQEGKPIKVDSILVGQVKPGFDELDLNNVIAKVSTMMVDIAQITDNFKSVLLDLKNVSTKISSSVDECHGNVKMFSQNMAAISKCLADPKKGLPFMIASVNAIANKIESIPLDEKMSNISCILQNTELLLQNMLDKKGTLGALINDVALYNNLNISIQNLNHLLIDIRKKPWRYLHFSFLSPKN